MNNWKVSNWQTQRGEHVICLKDDETEYIGCFERKEDAETVVSLMDRVSQLEQDCYSFKEQRDVAQSDIKELQEENERLKANVEHMAIVNPVGDFMLKAKESIAAKDELIKELVDVLDEFICPDTNDFYEEYKHKAIGIPPRVRKRIRAALAKASQSL